VNINLISAECQIKKRGNANTAWTIGYQIKLI